MANGRQNRTLILLLSLAAVLAGLTAARAGIRFTAIAWHDVVDRREDLASDAVTTDHLVEQFEWLASNGYHPVSVDRLLAAHRGEATLPPKPVLLCWDDGYQSFYNRVFPLLQAYNYPAVLALVGSWIEPGPGAMVRYGDNLVSRSRFLTRKQIRELADSGLVEIGSHSYNLHRGVFADPAGDRLPAAVTHLYDPGTGRYESDDQYQQRILTDLRKNSALLSRITGRPVRVMIWPYGRYNGLTIEAARAAGMSMTLTLDGVPGDTDHLEAVGRVYPTLNPDLKEFRRYLEQESAPEVRRFFKIETAQILDSAGDEKRLGRLLDRLVDIAPDMVAFPPVVRRGGQIQALFPNHRFPVARDRLIRLTWHISRRSGTSSFLWLDGDLFRPGEGEQEETVTEFFRDMGRHGFADGVVIDDAGFSRRALRAAESVAPDPVQDWDPARRRHTRRAWRPADPLVRSLLSALEAFQYYQPFVEVALTVPRSLLPELSPDRARVLLSLFDYLIIDNRAAAAITGPEAGMLERLRTAGLIGRISLMTRYRDDDRKLRDFFAGLDRFSLVSWGYAGDRFLENRPRADLIRPVMSRYVYPYR